MKKLIYLLIATVFFVSCTEESNEGASIDPTAKYFNQFLQSSDYEKIKINYPDIASGIDINSASSVNEKGMTVFSFESRSGNKALGSILFAAYENGSFTTIVQTYDKDDSGDITRFHIKDVEDELLLSFDSEKVDNNSYSLTVNKESLQNNFTTRRSWRTCTSECIVDAFSACNGDSECAIICNVVGLNCVGSISVTCAAWCLLDSSNDLTPEPPVIVGV